MATASLAQMSYLYFGAAADLGMATVNSGFVVLGGNSVLGDGGGGTFMPGAGGAACHTDAGIVFQDTIGDCFYRSDPTYSVREWGALCDGASVNAAGRDLGSWHANLGQWDAHGPHLDVVAAATSAGGQFIAISQIGSPTLRGLSTPVPGARASRPLFHARRDGRTPRGKNADETPMGAGSGRLGASLSAGSPASSRHPSRHHRRGDGKDAGWKPAVRRTGRTSPFLGAHRRARRPRSNLFTTAACHD